MVKGLDVFHEYFHGYADQYVLIGGAACSISFEEQDAAFRATKDLDMVLIVEALTASFGTRFWQFIRDGGYQNRARSNGKPQFFRFDKPADSRFPKMIELFSRTDWLLNEGAGLTPIHIDDSVSSLSAILLNDAYYQALLNGRNVIDGLSILRPEWLIPFKAKAWLDLRDKVGTDSADIKKHRNDIIRLASELILKPVSLPDEIRNDMVTFIDAFDLTETELKSLRIRGVTAEQIKTVLKTNYIG